MCFWFPLIILYWNSDPIHFKAKQKVSLYYKRGLAFWIYYFILHFTLCHAFKTSFQKGYLNLAALRAEVLSLITVLKGFFMVSLSKLFIYSGYVLDKRPRYLEKLINCTFFPCEFITIIKWNVYYFRAPQWHIKKVSGFDPAGWLGGFSVEFSCCVCVGFSQPKAKQIRSDGYSTLPRGVNICVSGCSSPPRVYPISHREGVKIMDGWTIWIHAFFFWS